MKQFVKNIWTVKYSLFVIFVLVFSANIVFANSNGKSKHSYSKIYSLLMNGGIENIRVGLESANDGLRMASVDQVGMLKITQLEDDVIELLDKEESMVNKKNVAVTLYQLGTYKTLIKLEEFTKNKDGNEICDFCNWLLNEYSKIDNDNWSNAVKIEELWAVDIPSSMMYREGK